MGHFGEGVVFLGEGPFGKQFDKDFPGRSFWRVLFLGDFSDKIWMMIFLVIDFGLIFIKNGLAQAP